jgi:hypothetical protein
MKGSKAQQEMVGFVLIVVIVIVGLMVFLVISLKNSPENDKSVEVGNMLDAVMKQTTDCAIVYEPDYDNFEDLFKSCYKGDRCSNLGESACDYLNESIREVFDGIFATEATISAYRFELSVKDGESHSGLLEVYEGNCTGSISSAQRSVVAGSNSLIIRMSVCKSAN